MKKTTKTVTVSFTGATVNVPTNATGWQLYSSMRGAGLAASRLTRAMEKALNAPSREDAIKIVSTALRADANYCDSIGTRRVAEIILSKGRGGDYGWAL